MSADPHPTASPRSADLHPTAQQLCADAGISRRMYFNALKVRRNGCDELNLLVRDGNVSMNLALEVARFDHPSQRLILNEFPTIKPRERLAFVARMLATRGKEGGAHG